MSDNFKLIILFGSRATNHAKVDSDYDIAVLGDGVLNLNQKSEIAQMMAKELSVSEDKIDVVDISAASPLLCKRISDEGKLLRGNEEDFFQYKIWAWKTYLDTAKFRRMREEYLSQTSHE